MTRFLHKTLRRFRDSEDGSAAVPFALWMPVMVGVILSTVELGAVTIRHQALERGLDQTVRDVRLGTGTIYDHASLKQSICEKAAALPDCMNTLQLEMVKLDLRNWTFPDPTADCVDTSLEVNPQREFTYGKDNEMMMLRACFKYTAVSPAGYLSSALQSDAQGYTAIISTAAFVQEPS